MSNGGSYNPHAVESEIYQAWEQSGAFHAVPDPEKRPFVIDIPLPNVTGALHVGHALNNTVQDILIRHKRMCGYQAMWMPGMDHAGIATQAVVEKKLKEEQNLTRHELGREGLVKRIWEWKEEYGGRILRQLQQIGCSCDWPRTRFTLDEVCARAVYEVFFQWFKAGLIYRGLRLVNWDTHLQTAVADDEIDHQTVKSNMWHYRYPVLPSTTGVGQSSGRGGQSSALSTEVVQQALSRAVADDARLGVDYLSIATTRPETMLGDTAIAVHPDDERYRHLIGQHVLLPLLNRAIPVIADGLLVKREFGTGCVKVTPAHDPNDYACGQRNGLEMINILTPDGKINEAGGTYAGQDRYDARKNVVADLEALGLMENIEPYEHEVGHSDRSKTPIEPLLSEQWFVKMGDLAETAMEAVRDGRVKFFPKRYEKTFLDWLGEKRDWCISRQLWWGHRIPVWTLPLHEPSSDRSLKLLTEYFSETGVSADVVITADEDPEENLGAVLHICARSDSARRAIEALNCWYQIGGYDPHLVDNFADVLRTDRARKVGEELMGSVASDQVQQDPDVLDTWFSSALWPFSTLGWPHEDQATRKLGNKATGQQSGVAYGSEALPDSLPRCLDASLPSPADLAYFYPTSVLVTAREIITLWVARMVMTGLYFTGRVPFQHVHIHPNIQDGQGRRMAKSVGNGVDPADIIERYGADALRFTMAQMDTETQDARLPVSYLCPHCGQMTPHSGVVPPGKFPATVHKVKCGSCKQPFATVWADAELKEQLGVGVDTSDRFEMGRNFCNKIWQAATGFVLPNLEGYDPRPLSVEDLALEDHWILSRLSATIAEVNRRLANYQLSEMAGVLYSFFWSDFCDWYVEFVKPRLFGRDDAGEMVRRTDASAGAAQQVLAWVLGQSLRLMHPVMPFVTEAAWKKLNEVAQRRGVTELTDAEESLIRAAWPDASAWPREADIETEMEALQNIIRGLRDTLAWINTTRAAAKTPAIGKLPKAVIKAEAALASELRDQAAVVCRLGRCESLEIGADLAKPPESATKVFPGIEVFVPIAGLADLDVERQRLDKSRDELVGHIKRLEGKLANEDFVSKAPAMVVEKERARLTELKGKLAAIERNLADIGG
ncbi:MAG: valine--tRNA ligase [Planctomycetota bacterium]